MVLSGGGALKLTVSLEDYWDDIFGTNDNTTEFFKRYLALLHKDGGCQQLPFAHS